jgi:hypothetical protein
MALSNSSLFLVGERLASAVTATQDDESATDPSEASMTSKRG